MPERKQSVTPSPLPTFAERRNGWNEEALAAYLAERERAQADVVLRRPPARPAAANGRYNPKRWRG